MSRIPLGRYLFTRLSQLGASHIHGVPGDYTLRALDFVHPQLTGTRWVGCCNELNAGYAADGYARVRGIGALCTTMGVGELSAINAVAGSFAEHVPVVHIVGTCETAMQRPRWAAQRLHHTLGHGRDSASLDFQEIAKKVTTAQVDLGAEGMEDNQAMVEKLDSVLGECVKTSRPVYVALPSDVVDVEVDATRLDDPISTCENTAQAEVEQAADDLLTRLYQARQPLILVDRGDGVESMRDEINQLVRISKIPTLAMPSGAGMVDKSLLSYFGVHSGHDSKVKTVPYAHLSDLVIAFGPMFSDTQTIGWETVPRQEKTILVGKRSINGVHVNAKRVIAELIKRVDSSKISRLAESALQSYSREVKIPSLVSSDPIVQTHLYQKLNAYLRPHDTIILGNGTPLLGGRSFVLPAGARVIASGLWFSIGHMLPAALGAALAKSMEPVERRGRTILLDGDGSFQVTAQELSTIIANRLDMTVFIFNNGGYTYERLIHGLNAAYNDIASWEYTALPRALGAHAQADYSVETHKVQTWGQLDAVLGNKKFCTGQGLKLVELVLDREDVPHKFTRGQAFEKGSASKEGGAQM